MTIPPTPYRAEETCSDTLNLHGFMDRSRANGPGVRGVVWFQGCTLACPGCFNPTTHSSRPHHVVAVTELVRDFAARAGEIEGITISGGEPLQQAPGLLKLLQGVRILTSLSVILFSGYTSSEIASTSLGLEILGHVDVLIDGRYVAGRKLSKGLRGSDNQTVRLLTSHYTLDEIARTPPLEICIGKASTLLMSGVRPLPTTRVNRQGGAVS